MIRYALVAIALGTTTVGVSAQASPFNTGSENGLPRMKLASTQVKVEAVRMKVAAVQQMAEAVQRPVQAPLPLLEASSSERWYPDDPADSLYRAARTALNRNDLRRAAQLFSQIAVDHPSSAYIPDALYWEAFSLYRLGGRDDLRRALALLAEQAREHANAVTRRDGDALAARIRGALAQQGDPGAASLVARDAAAAALPPAPPAIRPPPAPEGRPLAVPASARAQQQGCVSEDDDMRLAALNALLQMDAERALPVIRQVLARRDACAAPLREHAVFLLAQKRSPETETLLIDIARNDPDAEIRKNAVFWLSQVPGERSLDFLQDLLRTTNDAEIREQAVFAISQNRSPRGIEILRTLAEQTDLPSELRQNVIFWLGQGSSPEAAAFLRSLYSRLETTALKEVALFAISQNRGQGSERWLLDLAANERESTELRTRALFWATQSSSVPAAELTALYDRLTSREMKEQALFGLSQRRDAAALDKLISIARGDADQELRKRAIFWLGQSREPRAADAILDMMTAP